MTLPDATEAARYERTRWRSWDQRWVHRREVRAAAELVDRVARPGDRVLDLPCGYGRLTGLWRERAGAVFAADRSPAMARRAAAREWGGSGAGAPVHLCVADIRAVPFAAAAFDGVVVLRLLQHLAEPDVRLSALEEVARVAGRWALVSVYTGAPFHRLLRRLQGRPRKSVPRERLEAEVEAAGFRIVARRRPLPGLHAQALWMLEPGGADARGHAGHGRDDVP